MLTMFSKTEVIKWLVIAASVSFVAGAGVGAAGGYKWMAEKYYREKSKNIELVRKLEQTAAKVVIKYETVTVEKVKYVRLKGKEIIKEVPVYVTKEDDAACELRNGFVSLYDASLRGESPGPATGTEREPSGIALSTAVAEVIAPNNTEHLACREKLEQWKAFYAELKAQYEGR